MKGNFLLCYNSEGMAPHVNANQGLSQIGCTNSSDVTSFSGGPRPLVVVVGGGGGRLEPGSEAGS